MHRQTVATGPIQILAFWLDYILGSLCIEENLTGVLCLELLDTARDPIIREAIENNVDEFDMEIIM